VQDGLICCYFRQAAAALPCCYNSGWSAPSSARWYSSVLCIAVHPTTPLLWKVGLLPHPCFQPFYLALPPLTEISAPGRSACCPTPTLSACCLPHLHLLRVQLLAAPLFSEVDSVFYPILTVSDRLQFTVYVSQFCWGVVQLPHELHWIMFLGCG
jgi:hypothetical protein